MQVSRPDPCFRGLDPVAYLTRVFTDLPRATTQEHIDASMLARVAAVALHN